MENNRLFELADELKALRERKDALEAELKQTYATKEGTSITRQTGEVEWTAIKRTSDGRYQAVADEGENGFTAEKAAAFLNTVYTPVFTTSK